MDKSKFSLQKIFAYFFIGFICFLLIIFFIGTDIISSFGGHSIDPNVLAIVNGQKVYRIDFYRYTQQFQDQDIQGKEKYYLDQLIANVLFLQRAKEFGIDVTEERVTKHIRGYFKDKNTGTFDEDKFDDYLKRARYSISEFYRTAHKDVVTDEFRKLIQLGFAVTRDDVVMETRFLNSSCRIQYAYITIDDFKEQFLKTIEIPEFELEVAMDKNKKKFTDEKLNRKYSRDALAEEKFQAAAKKLFDKINSMAKKGESFAQTAALLGGKTGMSPEFILGDNTEKGVKCDPVIQELAASPLFIQSCVFTPPQKSSQLIMTANGLAVITPAQFKLYTGDPTPQEYNKVMDIIVSEAFTSASAKLMGSLREEAKIIKNLKTD